MTNLTDITHQQLQALKDFTVAKNKQLVEQLEEVLEDIKRTGHYIFPWHFMKPLYAFKLEKVTNEFLSSTPPLKADGTEDTEESERLRNFQQDLLQMFDKFICAPFTIQRLTELLINPKRHYKTTAKFFRGLEKNIMVVTTIDHVSVEQRQMLKRSHLDTISENARNGCLDNDLKPPVKKSVISEESETRHQAPLLESSTLGNPNKSTESTVEESSKENVNLENMLLCTEEVTDSIDGGATSNSVVSSSNVDSSTLSKDETPQQRSTPSDVASINTVQEEGESKKSPLKDAAQAKESQKTLPEKKPTVESMEEDL